MPTSWNHFHDQSTNSNASGTPTAPSNEENKNRQDDDRNEKARMNLSKGARFEYWQDTTMRTVATKRDLWGCTDGQSLRIGSSNEMIKIEQRWTIWMTTTQWSMTIHHPSTQWTDGMRSKICWTADQMERTIQMADNNNHTQTSKSVRETDCISTTRSEWTGLPSASCIDKENSWRNFSCQIIVCRLVEILCVCVSARSNLVSPLVDAISNQWLTPTHLPPTRTTFSIKVLSMTTLQKHKQHCSYYGRWSVRTQLVPEFRCIPFSGRLNVLTEESMQHKQGSSNALAWLRQSCHWLRS